MTDTEIRKFREQTLKEIVKKALNTIRGKDDLTNAEQIYGKVLVGQALEGNLKAIEMLTKLAGEDEPQKLEVTANVGITHTEAIDLIRKQLNQ